jgi:outer membrane protein TolC
MNLSWSVLVLALMGAQDQLASQTSKPVSSIPVGSDVNVSDMASSEPEGKADKTIAARPGGSTAATAATAFDPKPAASTKDAESGLPLARIAFCLFPDHLPNAAKPLKIDDSEVELWPMTLQETFFLALDHYETVRVISPHPQVPLLNCLASSDSPKNSDSGPIAIAPISGDASIWRFKAEVTAFIRSIEQQYWSLTQAQVKLWAADRAVNLARDVLTGEQAKLKTGRSTIANVEEAAGRVEQFNLDLETRNSDVITTERRLRSLLGLPPSDNRRIIPVTPPTESLITYDWDTCLYEMMDEQPDILRQKALVRLAELQLMVARNQLLPRLNLDTLSRFHGLGQQLDSPFAVMTGTMLKALYPMISDWENVAGVQANLDDSKSFPDWQTGYTIPISFATRGPLPNARQAGYILIRSRAYLNQIEIQTTQLLSRFFLEVTANHKQFKTSSRLRAAAAHRLDAQRVSFEEGRTPIDRYLDAISQYSTAIATEAQYKATYTFSLAALAEAKGTLLAERDIVIAEGPHSVNPSVQPAKSRETMPHAWPAITTIPQDLRTVSDVAGFCAAMMPEGAAEEPRVMTFAPTPLVSVNEVYRLRVICSRGAYCCDARPKAIPSGVVYTCVMMPQWALEESRVMTFAPTPLPSGNETLLLGIKGVPRSRPGTIPLYVPSHRDPGAQWR